MLFVFLLVCGVIYLIGRAGTLLIRDAERRRHTVARMRGKMLRRGMTMLGATFIKMGQVMSTRPDLFSSEVIAELRILQDSLPPFGFWRVRHAIQGDLGCPIAEIYTEFDETPVAAASVAQVHRARLHDDREVAVKVLRPGVRRRVERDATILLVGARVLAIHPSIRMSDPVGHLREFTDAIIAQTDLRLEASNYERFHENFARFPDARFPEVHGEFSGEHVLTLEFLRGKKVDEIGSEGHVDLARRIQTTMLKMCFDDGFLHADLHPGNMMVTEDDQLVIFDVGLCKLLQEDVLIQFIDMSKCLSMGTSDDLIAHLKRFHTYVEGKVDWTALRSDVDHLARSFRAQNAMELEYGTLISNMLALGRKYEVRPVTDMALVFVALITAQGIGKVLNPTTNPFEEVAKFIMPILMERGESVPQTQEARAAVASPQPS